MITIHRAGAKHVYIPGGSLGVRACSAGEIGGAGGVTSTYSVSFDGVDDRIGFASSPVSAFNAGVFTFTGWIKTSASQIFAGITKGSDFSYRVLMYTNGQKLQMNTAGGSNNFALQTTNVSVSTNEWTHFAFVMDSAGLKIYSQGVDQPLTSFGGSNAQNVYAGNQLDSLGLGATLNSGVWFFHWSGYIDDPRIYNAALSPTDIANLYAGQDVTAGLVAYWALEEGSGTNAVDSIGGNNGTLTNGPTWSTDVPAPLA